MELAPEFRADPAALSCDQRPLGGRRAGAARGRCEAGPDRRAAAGQPLRAAAGRHALLQPPPRRLARPGGAARSRRPPASSCPPTMTTSFQGTAQAFQDVARRPGLLLVLAIVVIYVVLGILYESFIHPITILTGLPVRRARRAGHAARLPRRAVDLRDRRRDHAGRHREEERHHDGRLRDRGAEGRQGGRARRSTRPASSASARS